MARRPAEDDDGAATARGLLGIGRALPAARWLLGAAAALLATTPSQAQAQRSEPRYALSWVRGEGAAQCPSGRELSREVERRLGRAIFDVAAERSLEVQVDRENGSYHSRVYVRAVDGRAIGSRALESDEPSCTPIFQATVLAVALVLDAEAESARDPSSAVAAFAPVTHEAQDQTQSPPPARAPAGPPPASRLPSAPSAIPETTPAPPAEERARTAVAVSARAALTGSLVPSTSAGLALHFSARPGTRWGLALGALFVSPGHARTAEGEIEIGLTAATLAATFDAARTSRARLVLEAGAWAGALQAAVLRPSPTDSGPFPFLALDVGARAEFALSRVMFVEIGAAGALPLVRQGFLVSGVEQPLLWREPALAGLGFFGLGTSFP